MRELHDRDGLSGIAISGFATHLTKPIQIEELQTAISDLAGRLHPT